jgi:hypothetical protein
LRTCFIDRVTEELFGSPEATAVLLDCLQATDEGRRWVWLAGDLDQEAEEDAMTAPRSPQASTNQSDSLQRHLDELRAEHAGLLAEFGDPEVAIDRFAEEFFGSDEAAEVLLDYVRRSTDGSGFAWDEQDDTDDGRWGR